jgi:hypothetical protein
MGPAAQALTLVLVQALQGLPLVDQVCPRAKCVCVLKVVSVAPGCAKDIIIRSAHGPSVVVSIAPGYTIIVYGPWISVGDNVLTVHRRITHTGLQGQPTARCLPPFC